jgi:two-component system chemotaxis response regulator CheB
MKIRVMVVDDSPLARQVIANALARDPQLEVVAVASSAEVAQRKLRQAEVDVLTLDLEMPKMNGLSFLRALLVARPIPTVMLSAFTARGSDLALRALSIGAVEVMAKPVGPLSEVREEFALELSEKVRAAAKAKVKLRESPAAAGSWAAIGRAKPVAPAKWGSGTQADPVILLGASTGGCEAIPEIISSLPSDGPPVVCIQHIPAVFSASFAARLDGLGGMRTTEARSGDRLERGRVYVAPGGKHLAIAAGPGCSVLQVKEGPLINRHRPSIDFTFRSAAQRLGPRAIAALLTGMGDDGVEGLLAIRSVGGFTLAQDEATSTVYGMPKQAIERGAASAAAPLDRIADVLLGAARRWRDT